MDSKAKVETQKPGRFSNEEVKTVMVAIVIGVGLGLLVEIVDSVLPEEHKMSAFVESFLEQRNAPKRAPTGSYDMERPEVRFPVTDLRGDRR